MGILRFASVWLVVAGSVLVPASAGRAQPQASEGGIAGVVLDPSGRRVEGAQVSALAADGAVAARVRTSDGGRFAVGVPPGPYRLQVRKDAFETANAAVQVVEGAPSQVVTVTLRRIDASRSVAASTTGQQVDGWIGRISDSACGAKHEPMEGVPEMTPKECTLATVRGGSKFVFVLNENDKVYQIANQDHRDLVTYAGDPVTLTGRVTGDVLTVIKLAAAPPSPAQAQAPALAGELTRRLGSTTSFGISTRARTASVARCAPELTRPV